MLLKGIIIKCSAHIREERTVNAIYHLLRGKRSIQTVQDAYIYELDLFYGVLKQVSKVSFDQMIESLTGQQYLSSSSATTCKPTTKGKEWLAEKQSELPFKYFNGLAFHENDQVFLERLFLLIQVLTNKKRNHSSFIPVIDKYVITNWMKLFYPQLQGSIDRALHMIYQELYDLLSHFTDQEAAMFVDRLTGYQHYGMSIDQLKYRYGLSANDVRLLFTGISQHMLHLIHQTPKKYPLLTKMINDLGKEGFLSNSAHQTYHLIKSGHSAEVIAKIRHLKINTIYDHIVEISLYDKEFPISSYVSKQKQIEIIKAIQEAETSKLKDIKSQVHSDISYFQIRLVLTLVKGGTYETI